MLSFHVSLFQPGAAHTMRGLFTTAGGLRRLGHAEMSIHGSAHIHTKIMSQPGRSLDWQTQIQIIEGYKVVRVDCSHDSRY